MAYVVTPELTELAQVAVRSGLGNGVDFYIRGIPFSGQLGSDVVGMSFDGSQYSVEYRDAGRTRDLVRTPDFAEAARRFLDEAERAAAGFEPRRPHRPDPVPEAEPGLPSTVLMGLGFGFLFGLLILPAVVLLVVFAALSGSYGGSGSKSRPWRGDWGQKLSFGAGTVAGLAVLGGILFAVLGR